MVKLIEGRTNSSGDVGLHFFCTSECIGVPLEKSSKTGSEHARDEEHADFCVEMCVK